MYDLILEIGHAIMRNGLSLSALGTALFVLLKQRKVKRVIRKHIPWLLRDDADVINYEARQIRIEQDVRAIKAHLGVQEWDAEKSNLNVDGEKSTSILQWVDTSRAGTAEESIRQTSMLSKSQEKLFHLRGNRTMKSYLKKLTRTKLQAYILATIMNVALLVGYIMDIQDIQSKVEAWMPMANMTVQTVLTLIYVWVEGSIDKETAKAQTTEVKDAAYTSSEDAGDV